MRAKKNYRLKQILFGRIVLPALGYLKQKQFVQIKKNVSHVKPLALSNSRTGIFLGRFERRIDILTYKLNFAPTIQWARVFVEAGLIYVSY
jgi:ribosomal protein S4